jgi:hypothetical protein
MVQAFDQAKADRIIADMQAGLTLGPAMARAGVWEGSFRKWLKDASQKGERFEPNRAQGRADGRDQEANACIHGQLETGRHNARRPSHVITEEVTRQAASSFA